MQAARDAFRACRRHLWDGQNDPSKVRHICNALRRTGLPGEVRARQIVMDSLGWRTATYEVWLDRRGIKHAGNTINIQAGRRAFVDACIAELTRRLKEKRHD